MPIVLLAIMCAAAQAAPSAGCDAINSSTLRLSTDTRSIGSSADQAQSTLCLAVGFNGGCFGRVARSNVAPDDMRASQNYDLAAGETVEFAIATSSDADIARIVVLEPTTAEITPLRGTSYHVGHSGTFRFELAASGATGHTATARATCIPASS